MTLRALAVVLAILAALLPSLTAQCGGVERWPVKVGSDPRAASINLNSPAPISLNDLVRLPRPTLPGDDDTRLSEETTLFVVQARLLKFKLESGRTGDQDYHLVMTDETLQFSSGDLVSPHSFIAEIVKPECVPGRRGPPSTRSRFQSQIAAVRAAFEKRFSNISGGWNDAGGIPVRVTGIGFFDRQHGQTGRAPNGIEIHPVLDIAFDGAPSPPPPPVSPSAAILLNPGFEDGPKQWVATKDVITNSSEQPARSGSWKAWLGGYGSTHTDDLSQQVSIPAGVSVAVLQFHLQISTEEQASQRFDTLQVQVRRANQSSAVLASFSNLDAAAGFRLRTVDLTAFRGQTIRIHFQAKEDSRSFTSFVLDDLLLVTQ